jgi:hypothetical protein
MLLGIKKCEVGLFRLPGILFDKNQLSPEKIDEMVQWAASPHGVGQRMTDVMWSFRTEAQRDWFILKWCDEIYKE